MMHTKGPWKACHDGDCRCKQIWSIPGDYPVATVNAGKWGDNYASLRFVEGGEKSVNPKVEAYMELMDYGEINEDVARANARLIAAAPELLQRLEEARDAIASLDVNALGFGTSEVMGHEESWPIRDELIDNISKAIRKAKGE